MKKRIKDSYPLPISPINQYSALSALAWFYHTAMFFAILAVANAQNFAEIGIQKAFSELGHGKNLAKFDGVMSNNIMLGQTAK